jgi:hypothetical protein
MSQIKVVEKIRRHILHSVNFSENRAVYEIMSKNTGDREAADNMARARCMLDK